MLLFQISSLHSLHRMFSSITRSFSTTISQKSTIKSISQDLYKERSLKKLVHKFKNYSDSKIFRTKIFIYEDTIRRLASAKCFNYIEEILEHQKKYDSDIKNEGFNVRMISLYGKSGMFDHARKVFDEMCDRNIERSTKSMNALLAACVSSGRGSEIEGLFVELREKLGLKADTVSYNVVINGCFKVGEVDRAVNLFREMEESGVEADLVTFNTVLDGLYSNKRFIEGEKMWERMIEMGLKPDIRSWNARIVGYVNEKMFGEAVKALSELENAGLKPDAFSYRALVRGYCDEGNLKEAKIWYGEVTRCKHPDKAIIETVISLAIKKGDLSWAVELCEDVFDKKCRVNAHILQEVVDRLVKDSKFQEAEKIVKMGSTNSYRCYKLNLPSSEQLH